MEKIYSNVDDCKELYFKLKEKMGDKIENYGTFNNVLFSGKYFSKYRREENKYDLLKNGIPFYYKYNKDNFFRIIIESNVYQDNSVGEKLVALSDFYQVLKEMFGEATVFYTVNKEEGKILVMHWSFVRKEEDIEKFRNGIYFDDVQVDNLTIIGDGIKDEGLNDYSEEVKKNIAQQFNLPFELLEIIYDNLDDFIKFKNYDYEENDFTLLRKII